MDYPNYYGILPASVRYAKISDRAKILFSEITALSNQWGYCNASNGYFAKLYDCSTQAISKHIGALEEAGFVRCTLKYDGKQVIERKIYPVAMAAKAEETARGYQPQVDRVSTTGLGGINPQLRGYQPQVEDNNTRDNNTSINKDIHIEAEEKKEENPDKIINASKYAKDAFLAFLEANPQYKLDVAPAKFAAAVDGHFNKLQREGQTFELQVPTDIGKMYSWVGKRMAGVRSWMNTAASFDKKATTTHQPEKFAYKAPVEAPAKRERLGPVEMPKF